MPMSMGANEQVCYTKGVPTFSSRLPGTATLGIGFPIFRTPTEFRTGGIVRSGSSNTKADTSLWFDAMNADSPR